jgi:hypothetical protein
VTLSYEKAKGLLRDLSTTFPDGVVVETPWPHDWNFSSIKARDDHAEMHLSNVNFHKEVAGLLERAA